MIGRHLKSILAVTLVLSACDRVPTDPTPAELQALASLPTGMSARNTLPALFRDAIASVEQERGRGAVDGLLERWRAQQDELRTIGASPDRAAIQSKLAALHKEELRVVVSTLGPRVVARVISDTKVDLARVRSQIAIEQSKGADMARAGTIAQRVREKLQAASNALIANQTVEALDLGTQAATVLATLDYYVIETGRIPGLEALLPQALAKAQNTPDATLAAMVRDLEQTNQLVRNALRSAKRSQAQAQLDQARAKQIGIVLRVLGRETATELVERVSARTQQVRAKLSTLDSSDRDVMRSERMLREAVDLAQRARTAVAAGDHATALDLASHAAGVLNAVQHFVGK